MPINYRKSAIYSIKEKTFRYTIMRIILSIIMLSILFAACKKTSGGGTTSNNNFFIFGYAYDECLGDCSHLYKIQNGKLYADSMLVYNPDALLFSDTSLNGYKFALANALQNDLPAFLKNKPNVSYGSPDCHDQGRIYLNYTQGDMVSVWTIDPDSIPSSITAYIAQLDTVLNKLQ